MATTGTGTGTGSDAAFEFEAESTEEAVLRVGVDSNPRKVATAISMALAEEKQVTLRSVGAGAVNQAVKACAIARGIVASQARDLIVRPGFRIIDGREGEITSIVLVVSLT